MKKQKNNIAPEKLALFGGKPVITKPLGSYNSIGKEEVAAANRFMKEVAAGKRLLSGFLGRGGPRFWGGDYVQKLELGFKKHFNVEHAVSFNSATTALQGALAAVGIGPGDEVITSPFTMPATATVVLLNGAIPVFADIDPDTYCITADSIKARITKKTKAILVVNIFGGSADYDPILKLAKQHKLWIIEDNAQSPNGSYHGAPTGTIGDIGVLSLNVHKTMQAGEGGMLLTNNKRLAYRAALVRNHGEAVADDVWQEGGAARELIAGNNYRLTELQSVILLEQLKKLDTFNKKRIDLANYLSEQIKKISWLQGVTVLPHTQHVYYLYPIKFFKGKAGFSRDAFVDAMKAEGFPMQEGYQKPLYELPIYKHRRIYEHSSFPFDGSDIEYKTGLCPVAERMYKEEIVMTTLCQSPKNKGTIDAFMKAIEKLEKNKDALARYRRA